jgi:hypothetical protein
MERAQLLGMAGAHAGIVGDIETAKRLITEALKLAEAKVDVRVEMSQRNRLADVLALDGQQNEAVQMLSDLLERALTIPPARG